jgi:hypothetical protein
MKRWEENEKKLKEEKERKEAQKRDEMLKSESVSTDDKLELLKKEQEKLEKAVEAARIEQ